MNKPDEPQALPQLQGRFFEASEDPSRILLVDDSAATVRLIMDSLDPGYEVQFALDGDKALAMIDPLKLPHVILLDVNMPNKNGYDVCRELKARADTRDIPVIFVTGDESEESEHAGITLGAVDYIVKPPSAAILNARLRTHIRGRKQSLQLERIAYVDALTGVHNRRYLDEALRQEWSRCSREGVELSLLMADIDHFKRHNDTYGHAAGDEALAMVGNLLRSSVHRWSDVVARYGGEEFVVVLPATSSVGALVVAEGIRAAVESLKPTQGKLTISIGCASTLPSREGDQSGADLLKKADEQLYRAKTEGRNRVRCA